MLEGGGRVLASAVNEEGRRYAVWLWCTWCTWCCGVHGVHGVHGVVMYTCLPAIDIFVYHAPLFLYPIIPIPHVYPTPLHYPTPRT